MPKKITVKCYGPIGINKTYQSSWEDVWLSWTDKPGRKKYYLAPCLCSKTDLKRDYQIELELKEDGILSFLKQTEDALKFVNNNKIYVYVHNDYKNIPTIYSPKDFIDRAEAERMISEVMKLHGYDSIICKWKRPKTVIIPM